MAGEILSTRALCLSITPWSKTSHVVSWLTPSGLLTTVVKGAVRSKSAFLGQYDLNYTCEVLYYARARGDLHVLRECAPIALRETLRSDFRALVLAGYMRYLIGLFAPQGPEAELWYDLLSGALDDAMKTKDYLEKLLIFELDVLHLMGLDPEIGLIEDSFVLRGERVIPVSEEVVDFFRAPHAKIKKLQYPLDAARVIGVFYQFHVDISLENRRSVIRMISKTT